MSDAVITNKRDGGDVRRCGTLSAILNAKRARCDPPEDIDFFKEMARKTPEHIYGLNTSTSTAVFYGRRAVSYGKYSGQELEDRKRFLAMVEEFA